MSGRRDPDQIVGREIQVRRLGQVDYSAALELQAQLVDQRMAGSIP